MKKKLENKVEFKVSFSDIKSQDEDLVMCNFKIPKEVNEKLNAKLKSADISKVKFFRAVIANYLATK